ncbi:hypothetical protein QQ045_031020 [Rhodiola kirilowii]
MSNTQQSFSSGQTTGQAQLKAEECMQSAKDSANAARDKTANAAQSAKESAQEGKDQSASFLQQTGEQIASMAHNAADTVKNTLGINDNSSSGGANRK